MTEAELLRGHARLTPDHFRAALLYAAAVIGMDEIIYHGADLPEYEDPGRWECACRNRRMAPLSRP